MIVMTSLRYSIIGIVGGTTSALLAVRVLKNFLFGLYLGSCRLCDRGHCAVLLATIAAWIPARYAAD